MTESENFPTMSSVVELPIFLTQDGPLNGWCNFRLMVGDQEVGYAWNRPDCPDMAFREIIRDIAGIADSDSGV